MHRRLPHLLSSPTRRSSDLFTVGHSTHELAQLTALLARARVRGVADVRLYPGSRVEPHVGRSEEHTAELQSRRHLVCRLLLEKKHLHVTRVHGRHMVVPNAGDDCTATCTDASHICSLPLHDALPISSPSATRRTSWRS